jgi:hypothetical protein
MLELESRLEFPYEVVDLDGPLLSQILHEGSKPGRGNANTWVLRASDSWAASVETGRVSTAQDELLAAFKHNFPAARIRASHAHFWRYASAAATAVVDEPLIDGESKLAVCGDAYRGPGLIGAWKCGLECADSILASLELPRNHD